MIIVSDDDSFYLQYLLQCSLQKGAPFSAAPHPQILAAYSAALRYASTHVCMMHRSCNLSSSLISLCHLGTPSLHDFDHLTALGI